MRTRRLILIGVILHILVAGAPAEIVVRDALVIGPVLRGGRSIVSTDPIEAMRIRGEWQTPREGDEVELRGGTKLVWSKVEADKEGWISSESLSGGYALATIQSEDDRVMMLDASGHSSVFVNGEPRAGDPYQTGFVHLPVPLKRGTNEFLFIVGRGRFRAKLVDPPQTDATYIDESDATLPDFVKGRSERLPFAVVHVNPTTQPRDSIPPLSVRKISREISYDGIATSLKDNETGVEFRIRQPHETRKITFISEIDGSVQYYALNPVTSSERGQNALILSLHGAAVEATNQADAYSPKSWADIVCPTNRRPYGFDWEDWGRIDALEVLECAKKLLKSDPTRIYLTGHSMGGHGTWQLGALYPDLFAAIGPSAGWISFSTYAGATTQPTTKQSSPASDLMRRAASISDTAALVRNYASQGIYILHGADDDNVPAEQARRMLKLIEPFHRDSVYHEESGAGHWWDKSDEPGADCVDWASMFDFFARHRLPDLREVREVNLVTPHPGVSSRSQWVTIEAQLQPMIPSSVQIRVEPQKRRFIGTTENVARISLELSSLAPGKSFTVKLDEQEMTLDWPRNQTRVWLAQSSNGWRAIDEPSNSIKGPHRSGPFKDAFRNRMIFVYGTHGTAEENAWALAKARFDAETFWYRGNGSVPVIPDTLFDDFENADRNIILYGHADMNACWDRLLQGSPIQVKRGRVMVGERASDGDGLACLMIRSRSGSDRACVGVICGSGMPGMRLTDRLPIFISGVGYPDWFVLSAEKSEVQDGGFFGNDWGLSDTLSRQAQQR